MAKYDFLLLYAILVGIVHIAGGLKCYQCGDSSINGKCVTDTAGMEAEYLLMNNTDVSDDQQKNNQYKYLKECPDSATGCLIERIEEQGTMYAYIRDCHKNTNNYSIPDPRFEDMDASKNHTVCIYHAANMSKTFACVTLCDTDFCNGPQISIASLINSAQIWPVLLVTVGVIFTSF